MASVENLSEYLQQGVEFYSKRSFICIPGDFSTNINGELILIQNYWKGQRNLTGKILSK